MSSHKGHASGMNLDGTSDSPQRGSPRSSRSRSRAGSEAGGSHKALGYDPARDTRPPMTEAQRISKRVDLPAEAYYTEKDVARFARRPGYSSDGKPIKVDLNIFNVNRMPRGDIYQYDLSIHPGKFETRPLMKKIWYSVAVKTRLEQAGGKWLSDYSKLAWSSKKVPKGEERINVDLDKEANKPDSGRGKFTLVIKFTKIVRLDFLAAYLRRQSSWDNTVLECMNFLDHVMRQSPSEKLVSIKRNFYAANAGRTPLDTYLEVIKGIYAAFRLSDSILSGGTGLSVNVDISNTTFWQCHRMSELALRMANAYRADWKTLQMNQLAAACRPIVKTEKDGQRRIVASEAFVLVRRLAKLKFQINHRGKMDQPKTYTAKRLIWEPEKYGADGANSTNVTFSKKDGTQTTVLQHFLDRWKFRIQWPTLPVMETSKGAVFPLEVCNVINHQRYQFKLDPTQTAAMIKIAVTRPDKRKADIMKGVRDLNWPGDPYLAAFDLPISTEMVSTKARLLPNPEITYSNTKVNPGVSGRWDLRGKKFLEVNQKPLTSWGMGIVGGACAMPHLEAFSKSFCSIYRGHGGKISRDPALFNLVSQSGDFGKISADAYQETGKTCNATPQLVILILPTKNQLAYERIKKNMDCRFCVVSQCLQGIHIKKNQAQYCSNVAMKVNAKLGGITCKIAGPQEHVLPFFKCPTMIIGLDVTHGAPGSSQPSMAAMTVSTDKHATRYAGSCETNGQRVELVRNTTIHKLFPRLLSHWIGKLGIAPKHVYYFRDGVSEGQFQDVIDQEVKELKRCFENQNKPVPKFTVIIATKRHHIRMFPREKAYGDRNMNPLPGTLVERDATHPFHWDFYLCSHVAIQGTARPVHYNIIHDELGVDVNLLYKMIYQQCYQYCRSTTPVSLHPAVYYSHLASQRARAHEDIAASQKEMPSGKSGFPLGKSTSDVYSSMQQESSLLPMSNKAASQDNINHINTTMWYI